MLHKPTHPELVQELLDGVRAKMAEGFHNPEDMEFFRSAMASSIASVLGLLRAAGEECDPDYQALKALLMELRGTEKLGETGAGKISPPASQVTLSTGFVLEVKPGEADMWRQWAKEAGRQDDIIEFGKTPKPKRKPKG